MDGSERINFVNHHAYIIEGLKERRSEVAFNLCIKEFCQFNGCKSCSTCNLIKNNQYYFVRWFNQDQYGIDDIDELLNITRLKLEDDSIFIFVLDNCQNLNDYASNKLLKLTEEPPPGFKFLFLTDNANSLLATLRSRCIIISFFSKSDEIILTPLQENFTIKTQEPHDFLGYISKLEISEAETRASVEKILSFWLEKYKNNENSLEIYKKLQLIEEIKNKLPMLGGSKIFWKNFYIKFKSL